MARLSHADIIHEMIELCREIMGDIRQQLTYYRASVYKDETAKQIRDRLEQLRVVSRVLSDDVLLEAFSDHDAVKDANSIHFLPGECSFSSRTTVLLETLENQFDSLSQGQNLPEVLTSAGSLAKNLQKHRNQLLSFCRYGSRHWSFFQEL
jgi:hypothetical protein